MGMPSQGCPLGGALEGVSQKAELEHPGAPNLRPRRGPTEARREGGPGEEPQEVVAAPRLRPAEDWKQLAAAASGPEILH